MTNLTLYYFLASKVSTQLLKTCYKEKYPGDKAYENIKNRSAVHFIEPGLYIFGNPQSAQFLPNSSILKCLVSSRILPNIIMILASKV